MALQLISISMLAARRLLTPSGRGKVLLAVPALALVATASPVPLLGLVPGHNFSHYLEISLQADFLLS